MAGSVALPPRHIVITGASSGLGAALAEAYAAPGVRLGLLGRNANRLDAVAACCEGRGATVDRGCVDVTDTPGLTAWLTGADDRQPVDLLIACAGITGGVPPGAAAEPAGTAQRLYAVNVLGAMATAEALLPRFRARRAGQVALMSSLAAFATIISAPTYSASKAALLRWGQGLRVRMAGDGVAVSVICPGFVDTPLSDSLVGPKPMMTSPQRAAARIRRGLARNRAVIAFPWIPYVGVRLLPFVPDAVAARLMRRFDYRVASPP